VDAMRVFVGPMRPLGGINKLGKAVPARSGGCAAGSDAYTGVQEEVKGPPAAIPDPVERDCEVIPWWKIPASDPPALRIGTKTEKLKNRSGSRRSRDLRKQGKIPRRHEVVDPGLRA